MENNVKGVFDAADLQVAAANKTVESMVTIQQEVKADEARRAKKAEKLPRYFREYYLRCHAYQLKPVFFILFFAIKKAMCWAKYGYLMLRRLIGAPMDYINTQSLIFMKNPIHRAIGVLNPGGEVYVPAGTNSISTEITAVSSMKLRGSGKASIVQAAAASNQDSLIYINEKTYVTIQDLYFDNNLSNQTSGGNACIKVAGDSANIHIKNIMLEGGCAVGRAGYAIYIDGGSGKTVENCVIENVFDDGWTEQAPIVVVRTNRLRISGCIFKSQERCAIDIKQQVTEFVIADNIFQLVGDMTMAQGNCISLNTTSTTVGEYPMRGSIANNVCYLCFGDAILMEKCFYITCTGNVVYGNLSGTSTADDGDMGISTAGADVTITGNVVCFVGNCGISLDGTHLDPSYRRVVTGNYVRDCGQNSTHGGVDAAGIWVNNTQFALISGNFVIDTQVSKTQYYGIRSAGTSGYNMYIGNYLHGNTTNMSFYANRDYNLVFANYSASSDVSAVCEFSRHKIYHATAGENWQYFSNNCGGQNPTSVVGLQIGYNKSNGSGEANIVWNSTTGAGSNLEIDEFDGENFTKRLDIIKGGGVIFPNDVELDGALNHDGTTVGFYGTTPIAQAVLPTGASKTVDEVITALQNLGLVKQS